jgi:putative membrane protein
VIPGWLLLTSAGILLCLYLAAEARLHRRGDRWPVTRSSSALGASLTLVVAGLWPARGAVDDTVVHLLVTMLAPLFLAVSAPVSLALRTLPHPLRRHLLRALHSRWSRAVTWLPLATVLQVGGLPVYYLLPVPPVVHGLLMAHMVAAGWLFATVVVGADPVPHHPGIVARSLALVTVLAAHDVIAKLVFARGGGTAAQVLFYGGDAVELLTAVLLFSRWYRRTRPRSARAAAPTSIRSPAGSS